MYSLKKYLILFDFHCPSDSSVVTEGHYDASFETEEPPPNDRLLSTSADHHVDHQLMPRTADRHARPGKMAPATKLNNGTVTIRNNAAATTSEAININGGSLYPQQYGYTNPLAGTAPHSSSFQASAAGPLFPMDTNSQQQRPTTIINNMLGMRMTTATSSSASGTTTTAVVDGGGGSVVRPTAGNSGGGRPALSPHSAQTVPTHISRLQGHQHQLSQVCRLWFSIFYTLQGKHLCISRRKKLP